MNSEILYEYYINRGFEDSKAKSAVQEILNLEMNLNEYNKTLINADISDIKRYVAILIDIGKNEADVLLALARYFYLIDRKDIYIYFTSIFGSSGVVENIKDRIVKFEGNTRADIIFKDLLIPELGAPLEEMPEFTKSFINGMENCLDIEKCRKYLAGNNHGIPRDSFLDEKKLYENSESLDQYLEDKHKRIIDVLQKHCDERKIWFEQIITQDVVNFVKSNQEILSAVRKDNKLYVTKIPYDTVNFLRESDENMKKYFLCHCPFIRESFRGKEAVNKSEISGNWCYCSAGFEKFPFEVIFDTELEVELLESPLLGDERCRFAIKLPFVI